MMYTILQVAYASFILCYVFYDLGNIKVFVYLLCPYWFLENLAHFIFVIKLWIIAQKLREIKTGSRDGYLSCKLGTIIALQMTFMISGVAFIPLSTLHPETEWYRIGQDVCGSIPGLISVAV